MNWHSMLLPHVLNSTWSAECAEFASIVIELVIGNYYPLHALIFFHYSFEVKLQLQNYCVWIL